MSEALLGRDTWLDAIVSGIADKRHAEPVRDALTSALGALATPRLSCALVVAEVGRRHAEGELLGSMATALVRRGILRDAEKSADALLGALSMFRGGGLTKGFWWRPELLSATLVELWGAEATRQAGAVSARAALERYWSIDAESAVALAHSPEVVEGFNAFMGRWSEHDIVCRYLESQSVSQRRSAVAGLLPEFARDNADLVEFAEWREIWQQWRDLSQQVEPAEAAAVAARLREFGTELEMCLRAVSGRFTMLELALLAPRGADDRILEDCVAIIPRRKVLTSYAGFVMVNGLPDQVQGVTLVPDWLEDEVYSGGARSGCDSSGPTAYMWLALEPHEEFAQAGPRGLRIGHCPDTVYPAELVVALGDAEDALPMSFPMGHDEGTRRFLALMFLTHRVIIDVFRIDGVDGLVLINRFADEVSDVVEAVSDRALVAIRASGLGRQFSVGGLDEHILGGFSASENAKSELLLSLDEQPPGDETDSLLRERLNYLDAEVSRVRLLHVHADTTAAEEKIMDARSSLAEAWGAYKTRRLEPPMAEMDAVADLRETVTGIATARRALVHFNFHSGHLEGFWVARDGDDRGWLSCDEVDLGLITRALRPWTEGQRGDADELVHVAAPLAYELSESLAPFGIQQAVIIPWAMLQGVPFGALPLGSGTLDDIMEISYSPSVAILRIGYRSSPARSAAGLVAAHGGTLGWADAEVRAVADLYGREPVVNAARDEVIATMETARVVHIASHGQWWREDHFASVLDLRAGGLIDRFISAAEIHRDVSLRGAEVAVLSACDTGRAPTDRRGIDSYTGLDAALLVGGARAVVSTMWRVDDFAAMLFSVNFHALLSRETSVGEAFTTSVHALRGGGTELHPAATDALDRVADGWRANRAARASSLSKTHTWAAYKLSGPHWLAQPLPRSQ